MYWCCEPIWICVLYFLAFPIHHVGTFEDKFVPAHATKAYNGSGGRTPPILCHGTRRTRVISFLSSSLLMPEREPPDSHLIGSWVEPRDGLGVLKQLKVFWTLQGIPGPSSLYKTLHNRQSYRQHIFILLIWKMSLCGCWSYVSMDNY
jgi:hypothetical protein